MSLPLLSAFPELKFLAFRHHPAVLSHHIQPDCESNLLAEHAGLHYRAPASQVLEDKTLHAGTWSPWKVTLVSHLKPKSGTPVKLIPWVQLEANALKSQERSLLLKLVCRVNPPFFFFKQGYWFSGDRPKWKVSHVHESVFSTYDVSMYVSDGLNVFIHLQSK